MNYSTLKQLIEFGITDQLTIIDSKHIRITNITALLSAVMIIPWGIFSLVEGETALAFQSLIPGILVLGILPLNQHRRHLSAAVLLMSFLQFQILWSIWLYGMDSGIAIYYVMVVFGAYFVFQTRHRPFAHLFSGLAAAAMIGVTVFEDSFPTRYDLLAVQYQVPINTAVAVIGLLLIAGATRNLIENTENAMIREQARADSLLLNVLPPPIAQRLKERPEHKIADRHSDITVLFADIVGFTPLSEKLSAGDTVELLNQVFTAFDAICDRLGIEKVRTIGDGYMAVAGAPDARTDHAQIMVQAALDMRDFMASATLDQPLKVRIGINTGEAVAGIVGTSRFHYDLWGDAVNVAARMESSGVPGKIQIAKATWEQVKRRYDCEPRGQIAIKGKGELSTWFVNDKLAE